MSGLRKNEQGMASILVTLIMIIVITLIVLGFGQVTRNNQREALDNQISTQAYYAAESGVNAAVNYLSANPGYNTNTIGDCKQFMSSAFGANTGLLNSGNGTQYTCLMVNPQPTSLNLSPLTRANDTVLHLKDVNGNSFTALKLQWNEQTNSDFPSGNCTSAANGVLPANNAWNCPFGIMRLDLVDGTNGNVSSASLDNNESVTSFYLIPSYQSGAPNTQQIGISSSPAWQPVNPATAPNAACDGSPSDPAADKTCPVRIVHVTCSTTNGCSLQLDISGGVSEYYARLSMMYQDTSSLTITGADSTASLGNVKFGGGQAVIDSTGQSEDELRRIQVRVPLVASQNTPQYGLQATDSICKQLIVNSTAAGSNATSNCP